MTLKPTILQCVGNYGYDGISRVATEISVRLNEEFDFTILAWKKNKPTPIGVKVLTKGVLPPKVLLAPIEAGMHKIFNKSDIIHVHAHYFIHGAVCFGNKPIIYTHHGVPPCHLRDGPRQWLGAILADRLLKVFVPRVNAIISVSKFSSLEIKNMYNRDSVLIPPGVDLSLFNPKKDAWREKFNHPMFLYVGALATSKAVHEIILAMKKVVEVYPRSVLVILGDGPQKRRLEELVNRLELSANVCLIPEKVDDETLSSYYGASDVFVTASRWELFGIPVLEAMASGKPAVVSNLYSLPEHVQASNAGAIFEAGNIDELSSVMISLAEKSKKLEANAISYAKLFSWDKIIPKISEIYWNFLTKT